LGTSLPPCVLPANLWIKLDFVAKWETGDKKPSRMAPKLLAVVKKKGLEVVA
jgi:DNA-binding transcriptional regulator YiaG